MSRAFVIGAAVAFGMAAGDGPSQETDPYWSPEAAGSMPRVVALEHGSNRGAGMPLSRLPEGALALPEVRAVGPKPVEPHTAGYTGRISCGQIVVVPEGKPITVTTEGFVPSFTLVAGKDPAGGFEIRPAGDLPDGVGEVQTTDGSDLFGWQNGGFALRAVTANGGVRVTEACTTDAANDLLQSQVPR